MAAGEKFSGRMIEIKDDLRPDEEKGFIRDGAYYFVGEEAEEGLPEIETYLAKRAEALVEMQRYNPEITSTIETSPEKSPEATKILGKHVASQELAIRIDPLGEEPFSPKKHPKAA